MTLRELEQYIRNLREDVKDKEVVMEAPNGLFVPPSIKFDLLDHGSFSLGSENVRKLVITPNS